MIRIVSGVYRGRRLRVPPRTRPTADRVREAVFDTLRERVHGSRCLDLFAGSGAMGIEALSRGADFVVFCDNRRRCIEAIAFNVERLQIDRSKVRMTCSDALATLEGLASAGERFNLVFVDPPYSEPVYESAMLSLDLYDIVAEDGVVVVERCKRVEVGNTFGNLLLTRSRRYGDTLVDYFEKKAEA